MASSLVNDLKNDDYYDGWTSGWTSELKEDEENKQTNPRVESSWLTGDTPDLSDGKTKKRKKRKRKKKTKPSKEILKEEPVHGAKKDQVTEEPVIVQEGSSDKSIANANEGKELKEEPAESENAQKSAKNSKEAETPRNNNPNFQLICEQHRIEVLRKTNSRHPRAQYLCTICQYYCDSWTVVERHIQKNRHLQAWEEYGDLISVPLIPDPLPEQYTHISNLLHAINAKYEITEEEYKLRESFAQRIGDFVKDAFPGCVIELCGSSRYRMALKTSDVNFNLDVPEEKETFNMLIKVHMLFSGDTEKYKNVVLDAADIPTIRFIDNKTNFNCTVSLNHQSACQMSTLLLKYSQFDPRARPLIIAFRIWAKLCGLDKYDCGMIPSHAFPIMAIFFLQQVHHPVLPVVLEGMKYSDYETFEPDLWDEMKENGDKTVKPDQWDMEDLARYWKKNNTCNLGELWLKLFCFYLSDFDVSDKVVSIQSIKPVKRSTKKWFGKRIAIEDPLVPHRNISKTLVHVKSFNYFMTCMCSTYLYFATPQTEFGPILHRVQKLPVAIHDGDRLLQEREGFLKYVLDKNPCFQSDETLVVKQLKEADKAVYDISKFTVTPYQAATLFKNFNPKFLTYEFTKERFTGGKVQPLVCVLCRDEGHGKDDCPDETLPQLEDLPIPSPHQLQLLSEMCGLVYDFWKVKEVSVQKRREVVSQLEDYLIKTYPKLCLTLFGSSCNGFGLLDSDMDLCLTFSDSLMGEDVDSIDFINELNGHLRKCSFVSNLVPITTAKVPILKFTHCESKLEGDISIYNTLATVNTLLLRTYCAVDQRAQILGCVVKRFAKICDICDASRGSLSSYAYVLMVIYFLQQCDPPVLPNLQELLDPEDRSKCFFDNIEELPKLWPEYGQNKSPVGLLWIQFLRFYTEVFDFKTTVVCIRRKKILPRLEKLWNTKCMAIEDPFDLNHNLGAGLSRKMYHYIQKSFRKGRSYFGNPKNLPAVGTRESLMTFFQAETFQGSPPDRACYTCKKIGHLSKECPSAQQGNDERQSEITGGAADLAQASHAPRQKRFHPQNPHSLWKANSRDSPNTQRNQQHINSKTYWNSKGQGTHPPKASLAAEPQGNRRREDLFGGPSTGPPVGSHGKQYGKHYGRPPNKQSGKQFGKPYGKPSSEPLNKTSGNPRGRPCEDATETHGRPWNGKPKHWVLQSPAPLPAPRAKPRHNTNFNLDYKPPNLNERQERIGFRNAEIIDVYTPISQF